MRSMRRIPLVLAAAAALLIGPSVSKAHAVASKLLTAPIGEAGQDFFGQAVGGGGDVNGDGFDDFVVGAYWNDAGGNLAGRAYVFFGGPSADDVPDVVMTGEVALDQFGNAVAIVGDINGDGYDDVAVGAMTNDTGGAEAGQVYIYFGGASMDNVADVVYTGFGSTQFGFSVSPAGDYNADGYDDVIVGQAPGPIILSGNGRAFVYVGGAVPNNDPAYAFDGEFDADNFGVSVSNAGDLNADGFDDVIVGAANYDSSGFNRGRAYVFYGGPGADQTPDLILTGESGGSSFGARVSEAGDVNGDGYDDVLVTAPTFPGGRAYVYFGGPSVNGGADWILTGTQSAAAFGSSAAGGSDYNRDGYADVLIGSELYDALGFDDGRAFIFYGGAVPDVLPDIVFAAEAAGDYLGAAVANVGDVTGDDFVDVLVGAPRNDLGGGEAGRAYLHNFSRYVLTAPNGGETWPVGSQQVISWEGDDPADVWLSWDGGFTYELLREQAGGSAENATSILVPHVPTRFAMVRVTPTDVGLPGQDQSDSLFTIETDIALLMLRVTPLPTGGAELTWSTDPAVGPAGISGYRLYRSAPGAPANDLGSAIGPSLITATTYQDPAGVPGSRYRLTGVNGLGQEMELGRTALARTSALVAWPQPYSGGQLNVSFAAAAALGNSAGRTELDVFDAAGRRVRTLVAGEYTPGFHTTTWDGLDAGGRAVPSGIYFLQLRTEGQSRQFKVVVAR